MRPTDDIFGTHKVRKAVVDAPPPGWPHGLKRYVEAKVGYQFWFRIGEKPHFRYYRANLQRATKASHGMPPLVPTDRRTGTDPHDEMGSPVFVIVPKAVEDPEWTSLGVPSMLRLERLKVFEYRPNGRTERLDLPEILFPLVRSFTDWEFCIVGWAERVNEIVEARAKAVDAIPHDELQAVWERSPIVRLCP